MDKNGTTMKADKKSDMIPNIISHFKTIQV